MVIVCLKINLIVISDYRRLMFHFLNIQSEAFDMCRGSGTCRMRRKIT